MHDVLDAIEAFFAHLSSVELVPLLIAVGCHLVKLACTSRAWRNVIAAAYPDERVPWPPILGAYVVGVGVNAVVPARAGDVMRLYLAHRAVPGEYLHHARLHLCRHGDNGHGARGRAVRLRAHARRPAGSLAPPRSAQLRLRLVHRPPARGLRDPVPACSRRPGTRDLVAAAAGRLPCSVLPRLLDPPRAVALPPRRRRVAARRLGLAVGDDLVLPRRVRRRAERAERPPRPGDAQPGDARADQPWRHRQSEPSSSSPSRGRSRSPRCSRSAWGCESR